MKQLLFGFVKFLKWIINENNIQEREVKESLTFSEAKKRFLESKWTAYKESNSPVFRRPGGVDIATQTTSLPSIHWFMQHTNPGFCRNTDASTSNNQIPGIHIRPYHPPVHKWKPKFHLLTTSVL
jgi:hypothetical protein